MDSWRRCVAVSHMPFPKPDQETELHERMAAGDPLAPADVAAAYMLPLASVTKNDLRCDDDNAHDAAVDALLYYFDRVAEYDPSRGRLATYLVDIAKKRCIDRLRSSTRRAGRDEKFGAIVELGGAAPKERVENRVEAAKLWDRIEKALPDARDRAAVQLVVDGERSTEALAVALGLPETLSEGERRAEVKRHRDRLVKTLERLGEKLDDGDR